MSVRNAGWCKQRTLPAGRNYSHRITHISAPTRRPLSSMPGIMQTRCRLCCHWVSTARSSKWLPTTVTCCSFFLERNIPNLGIEPTESTASVAREKGITTLSEFFGVELAGKLVAEGLRADLMAANNVLAHVPDINDFLSGFALLLADDGVVTFEFPHLLSLVEKTAFDTIYHEH